MSTAGFELLDHTSDVGILARAATFAGAFEQAARGLYALMVDLDQVEPLETREVTVAAPDRERLLVAWLAELLFLTESEGLVFSTFQVEVEPETITLRALAHGEPLDPARHDPAYDVKAITYHDLEVAEGPEGWRCRVIVDV